MRDISKNELVMSSSIKNNVKEDGKQELGPVFYQCDKCATFFRSKPLAAIHLWTADHGKPTSDGWRTVPFPTPILKLHRLAEAVEAPEVNDENDVDQESPASPLFAPFVEMEVEVESENGVEPWDESNSKNATFTDGEPLLSPKQTKPICDKCGLTFYTNFKLRQHQHYVDCSSITDVAGGRVGFTRLAKTSKGLATGRFQVNSEVIKCDKCDITFGHARYLRKHLDDKICSNVKTPSSSETPVPLGGQNAVPSGGIICDNCGITFLYATSLERHLEKKDCVRVKTTPLPLSKIPRPLSEKSKRVTCDKCGLTFASDYSLRRHQDNVTDCSNQDQLARLKKIRQHHPITSGGYQRAGPIKPKTRMCRICGIKCSQRHYEYHMKTHSRSSPAPKSSRNSKKISIVKCNKCDKCNVTFLYATSLERHITNNSCLNVKTPSRSETPLPLETQSELPSARIICNKCGLTFASNYSLERHQNFVTDCSDQTKLARLIRIRQKHPITSGGYQRAGPIKPKTRLCRICGIKCSQRHFEDHMKTCSRSFPAPKGIRYSRQRRLVKCDRCNGTFLYVRSLQRHLRNKTCIKDPSASEGPYSSDRITCDKCGLTYSTPSGLKRHKATSKHCERRICPVSTCRKSFYRPEMLEAHVRFIHDTKNGDESGSQCAICGEEFELSSKLLDHLAQKHDVDQEEDSVVLIKNEEMIIEDEPDVDDYERPLFSGLETECADVKLEDDEMEEFTEQSVKQNVIFDILDPHVDNGREDL